MLTMSAPPLRIGKPLPISRSSSSTALLQRRRGRADHQLRIELCDYRPLGPIVDLGQEDLGAPPTGLEKLLPDRRQAHVVSGFDVVVPNDRQVVWDVKAQFSRGGDHTQCLC